MVALGRLVVPLYSATRVLKVSEQIFKTKDLNRRLRTFKENVRASLGLRKDQPDSIFEALFMDASYVE